MKKTLSMRLDADKIEKIKEIARLESVNMNRDISYTDLIRTAIDRAFFNEKK